MIHDHYSIFNTYYVSICFVIQRLYDGFTISLSFTMSIFPALERRNALLSGYNIEEVFSTQFLNCVFKFYAF